MKLLIADDEDYTREGLLETVCWERYGIDEIMQAVNGTEAARIAKWFLPDIILTDIRMPKMDGIEFASKMLQWNPECRIIFMSGYMEIEYLKSAIRLSAIDYIEKPIDIKLLEKALQKAADEIDKLHKSRAANQMSMEFQQQKLFYFLISKEPQEKTIKKLAKEADFPLMQNCVCVIVWMPKEERNPKKQQSLNRFFEDSFCRVLGVFNEGKQQFEFVLSYPESEQYRLAPLYQRLLEAFPKAKLGVGVEAADYRNIYNSYRTAGAAINCAFYQEDVRLFQIDEGIMQKSIINPRIYGEFLQLLSENPKQLKEWFEQLFAYLYARKYYLKEHVYTLMVSLLTAVYGRYPELYGVFPICREEDILPYVRQMETLGEIQRFIQKVLEHLSSRQEVQSGYSRIIRGVIDYVAKHYGEENLSVTDIAEHLHFSSAYLNVLFKQEMKMTLKQYLSNYRLDCAKRMLEQGYDKIGEVAERCGYANANYFAKVFRDSVGMSPTEYQRKREQTE